MADSTVIMYVTFFITFLFVMSYGLNVSMVSNGSIFISNSDMGGTGCTQSNFNSMLAKPNLVSYSTTSSNGTCFSTEYNCSACAVSPFGPQVYPNQGNTGPCVGPNCANTGPCVGPDCGSGITIGSTGTGPATPGNMPNCCIAVTTAKSDWTCGISNVLASVFNVLAGLVNMIILVSSYVTNFFTLMFGPCSIFGDNPLLSMVILVPIVMGVLYIAIKALKP